MWLSKAIKGEAVEDKVESGSITISVGDSLEATSSVAVRAPQTYSPYGYVSQPPAGEEVMLVPSADGQAIVGTKAKSNKLEAGEIQITSKGGAKIILKNDGSVVINSLIIDKEGKLIQ